MSSTSILYIIHHPSSPINNNINIHGRHQSITPSYIFFCIINIHHPASFNNTNTISNIIFFFINYQNQLPSTSIIHRQHHHPTSSSLSSIIIIILHQHPLPTFVYIYICVLAPLHLAIIISQLAWWLKSESFQKLLLDVNEELEGRH